MGQFVFSDENIFYSNIKKYLLLQSECCWSASKQTDLLEGKRRELLGEGAWFLIARDADTKIPLAFSHFRLALVRVVSTGLQPLPCPFLV